MKILNVRFKNINSLRGEHVIDLETEPLKSAGLFAITGPTGSGKTTILDVIALAIYNRVPRLSGSITKSLIEKTGAILTRNTEDAYAEVEYACKKGNYRSRWSISTARTGNLKEWHMEVANLTDDKPLDAKRSEVAALNEELIGLSYDQFIRSILLAQGDFAKFLRSKKDERGKLLEQITGTAIYRQIGIRAFEMNREHGRELADMQMREGHIKEKLMDDAAYSELSEKLRKTEQLLTEKEIEKKRLEKQVEQKLAIQKLEEELATAKGKEAAAKEKLSEFEAEHGQQLNRHRALIPHQEKLRNWKDQKQRKAKLEAEKTSVLQTLEEATKDKQKVSDDIVSLLSKEVGEDDLVPALAKLEKEVLELNRKRDEARHELRTELEHAKRNARQIGLVIDANALDEALKETTSFKEKKVSELEELRKHHSEEELKSPSIKRENLLQVNDAANECKSLIKWIQSYTNQLEESGKEAKKTEAELQEIESKLPLLKQHDKTLRLELEGLRKDQKIAELSQSLESHRIALVDGKPCPLCGAEHHPYADDSSALPEDASDEIALKATEQEAAAAKVIQMTTAAEALQKQLRTAQNALRTTEANLNESKERLKAKQKEIPEEWRSLEPVEVLERSSAKMQSLKHLEQVQVDVRLLDELLPSLHKLCQLRDAGVQLKQQFETIYAGKDIRQEVTALRSAWQGACHQLKQAEKEKVNWETALAEAEKAIGAVEEELQTPLQTLGYSGIAQAMEALLPGTTYEELMHKGSQNDRQLAEAKKEIQLFNKQLVEQKVNESQENLTMLQQSIEEVNDKILETNELRDIEFSEKKQQATLREELQKLVSSMAEQKKKNEKWLLLYKYIGDAEGRRFSTFAQELTLKQLVGLANRRLETLSDRYLLDLPADSEDESMAIIDRDMGSLRRSVRTLSGGESFLISLSLALALSDLASRNVEIKSLFIDEGFGTLDPITLDQTLDTLEKLQAESNKTIGIISHVDALKERITTQIAVVPNGQGFSRLEVLPREL